MENNILLHLKVYIPRFNLFPFEKAKNWAEETYLKAENTKKQLLKSVPDAETLKKKIAQPLFDTTQKLISPGFVSKSGLSTEIILKRMKAKLESKEFTKKYRKAVKQGFRNINKETLDYSAAEYALAMTFGAWRFIGPIEDKDKGACKVVETFFSRTSDAQQLLREKDELLVGEPLLIGETKKQGVFKRKLHNQLMSSGQVITDCNYDEEVINSENNKINNALNEFIRNDIAPFSNTGWSHLDFIVKPENVEYSDSPVIRNIMYKIYKYFMGQIYADKLKTRWESTPPSKIDEGKKKYPEMYLDIQVMGK